jgi:hypothetical protein
MRYIGKSACSAYVPKLLGIYERELWEVIEQACSTAYDIIIDIGAAEGYYAVGLALRNPSIPIIAFEADPLARELLAEMCELNQKTSQVAVEKACDSANLAPILSRFQKTFVICDVEGFEKDLLNLDTTPGLRNATLLVELHEFASPSITQCLKGRFERSHSVKQIWQTERERSDYPFATLYDTVIPKRLLIQHTVSEERPERMSWLYLEPRHKIA